MVFCMTEQTQMEITKNTDTLSFFENVANVIAQARTFVGRTADLTMCAAYFEVGRMIVEEEQGGEARAKYGRKLLASLSAYLNANLGKGYSETTLRNARKFYQIYSPSIQQTMCAESEKQQILFAESSPFRLSWSHYLVLMRMKNADQRRFYEIEAIDGQWTLDRLKVIRTCPCCRTPLGRTQFAPTPCPQT
jgi:hypothetical protein